jgi:UDP-N-acetyl-D-galactosamine dehydrogenase
MMGLTFKENGPDLRNTRVTDMLEELASFGAIVDVFDSRADADEARQIYGISPLEQPGPGVYDAIILAVGHD